MRWDGRANRRGRGVRDGVLSVRSTAGLQTHRIALLRRDGRLSVRPAHDRSRPCDLLSRVKVERPAFGGRRNQEVGIALRTQTVATRRV